MIYPSLHENEIFISIIYHENEFFKTTKLHENEIFLTDYSKTLSLRSCSCFIVANMV